MLALIFRTTTKPNRQNDRPHPSTSSIYTTNSNLGSQQFQSNSAHQSVKSTRRPLIVPKEENFYGETYSTMSTPAVSSVCPSVLNARNWQTEDQIEMVQKAKIKQERRQVSFLDLYNLNAIFSWPIPDTHPIQKLLNAKILL